MALWSVTITYIQIVFICLRSRTFSHGSLLFLFRKLCSKAVTVAVVFFPLLYYDKFLGYLLLLSTIIIDRKVEPTVPE